ncbi:glycosyltransferase family 2 protein [Streptomyces albidoflavus]
MLSIVIPVYAQSGALHRTLSSLARQSADPEDFEIVLVDDASPQSVTDVAKQFDGLPLRVERHEENRGRSAARNTGLRASRGAYVLFLDADSVTHRDLVRTHLELHRAGGERAVLGRRIEPDWENARLLTEPDALPDTYGARQDDIRRAFALEEPGALHGSPWLFAHSHNLSVTRSALEAVGGFDENFRSWGWEDTELTYRLFLHWGRDGRHFTYAREAVCYHVPHFADHTKNWSEATVGLRYLKEKHPHFDVERLGEWPRHQILTQPDYAAFLLRPGGASEAAFREVQEALPGGTRRLWAGRLSDRLSTPPAATMDATLPASELNKPLLGMQTPWKDDSFDDVVHWDNWRALGVGDLSGCIAESLRMAPVVHLAGTRELDHPLPLAQQDDLALALESARLGVRELPGLSHAWITEVRRP